MTTLPDNSITTLLTHCKSVLTTKKLSLTSRKLYLADIKRFLTWLPNNNLTPSNLSNPNTYQKYLSYLKKTGLSPSMLRRTIASLKQLGIITNSLYSMGNPMITPTTSTKEVKPLHFNHIKHFTNYLKQEQLSPSTIKSYKSDITRYIKWVHESGSSTKIDQLLTDKNIQKYLNYLANSGQHPTSTCTRKQASLTRFQSWYLSAYPQIRLADKIKSIFPTSLTQLSPEETNSPQSDFHTNLITAPRPAFNWSTTLSLGLILLLTTSLGIFGYQAFSRDQVLLSQAYPSTPISPNRQLSFQGRLEDSGGTPITTSTNLVFKLFDASSSGSELYSTGTCAITPDSDGVFSTQIGSTCGSGIGSDVFSENADVWLEVTVASEVLDPRQQIATVAYALNSETLQGIPLSSTMSAIANSIVPMNSGGEIIIGEQSPTMRAISGTFAISAPALSITTTTGSSGNISIAPDGTGEVNLTGNTTSTNFFNVANAQLTTGSLITGTVANSNTGYLLLDLLSGTSPTSVFSVADDGDTTIAGDLTITGDDLFMNTNTANYFLMADGTNYNPTTPTAAVTGLGLDAGGAGDIWVEKAGDTMTGQLLINLGSDTQGIIIQGDASQTANLIEIQDSSSNVLSGADERGILFSDGNSSTTNVFIGDNAGNITTSGTNNIAIGNQPISLGTSGSSNISLGYRALRSTTGSYNTASGYQTLFSNTTGSYNIASGYQALEFTQTGAGNISLGSRTGGYGTGSAFTGADYNTIIGYEAGYNLDADMDRNVYIGYQAGFNATGSDKLYIDNSDSASPLIYGEFDNDILRVNGTLQINDPSSTGYAFPTADGTTDYVLTTDGAGTASWAEAAAGVTADSLDYIDFEDTMDLDANLILNQGSYTWTQNFTGTTTDGYTYNANSLTSGTGIALASTATALTGDLQSITLSGSHADNTGSLLAIDNTGVLNTNTSLYIKHYATGTNNLAFRVDDESGDTTPFVIDGDGNVGVGITDPAYNIDVFGDTTAEAINSRVGFNIDTVSAPPNTFTATAVSGSGLEIGQYYYHITYYTALGETGSSSWVSGVTTSGNQQVDLSSIPTSSDSTVIGRKIYRGIVGESSSYGALVGTIADNTTTTHSDTYPDSSITGASSTRSIYAKPNTTSNFISLNDTRALVLDSNLTSVGVGAGASIINAPQSVFVGKNAGSSVTSGNGNTLVGDSAGYSITTGTSNIGLGPNLLGALTDGSYNIALGWGALRSGASITHNTSIGYGSGAYLSGGSYNVAIGDYSGDAAGTRSYNTQLGASSGGGLTSGASNVFLGYSSGSKQTTNSSRLIIDNQIRADAATELTNSILYGVMAAAPADQTLRINAQPSINGAYTLPIVDGTTDYVLTTDGAGTASWAEAAAGVTADSLDYIDFEDTMDLDANLILNQGSYTWTQNFTGTTTDGYTYNANSLTSGSALALASTATAFTGDLQSITLSGSHADNTGSLLAIDNTGVLNTNTSLYIKHYATGTNNLAFRVDDESGDTTPFVIDGDGNVGINTDTPSSKLSIGGATSSISNASGDITIDSASNFISLSGDSLGNILDLTVSGEAGIGTASPDTILHVTGATTGMALAIFDETGDQDIITASASGSTRFRVATDGDVYGQSFVDTSSSDYYLDPATTGNSLVINGDIELSSGGTIASTSNANIILDAGSGTVSIGSSGTGKLDAGTIDPPYSINGDKFATYLSGMTGVKEETTGKVNTSEYIEGYGYRTTLNLATAPQGSDLWLFREITNLHEQFDSLVILLSASSNTRTWYNLHPDSGIIEIYSTQPSVIGYRLTAPRFDADTWANTRDSDSLGFILEGQTNWNQGSTPNLPTPNVFTEIFHSLTTTIAQITSLETNLISPLNDSQPLTIATNTVITPQDSSLPTLTIDGEIQASSISARIARLEELDVNTLRANNIIANSITAGSIEGLDAKIASLSAGSTAELSDDDLETITDRIKARLADLTGDTAKDLSTPPEASSTAIPIPYTSYSIPDTASDSATLASLDADMVFINDYLAVIGSATITNLDITGYFYTDSIISKSNTLALQPNGGLINLANNTLIVDSTGQVIINGDLTVKGQVLADSAQFNSLSLGSPAPSEAEGEVGSQLGQLLAVYNEQGETVATIDASGSASFRDLSTQLITIAAPSDSTESASTSALAQAMGATSTSNATAGNSTLTSPNTEIMIESEFVTTNSLVYLTPTTNTDNKVLFVASKETCPPPPPDVSMVLTPCTRSFTVAVDTPANTDIEFNWWVIQLAPSNNKEEL